MTNFHANSPYAQLSDSLFGAPAMARSRGAVANQAAGGADVHRMVRPSGGGVTRNLFDATSGVGAAAANRAAAPLSQSIADQQANAGWQLGKQNANEQFGNAMFGRMANNWAAQNNPADRWRMIGSMGGLMNSLFS